MMRIESVPHIVIGTAITALILAGLWSGWSDLALWQILLKAFAIAVVVVLYPAVVFFRPHSTS